MDDFRRIYTQWHEYAKTSNIPALIALMPTMRNLKARSSPPS